MSNYLSTAWAWLGPVVLVVIRPCIPYVRPALVKMGVWWRSHPGTRCAFGFLVSFWAAFGLTKWTAPRFEEFGGHWAHSVWFGARVGEMLWTLFVGMFIYALGDRLPPEQPSDPFADDAANGIDLVEQGVASA